MAILRRSGGVTRVYDGAGAAAEAVMSTNPSTNAECQRAVDQRAARALGAVSGRRRRAGRAGRDRHRDAADRHAGGDHRVRLAVSGQRRHGPGHDLLDAAGAGLLVVADFGRARDRGRRAAAGAAVAAARVSLTLVLVAFFIIEGVASIMFALDHKRELSGRWGWMLVSGIVDLVLARDDLRRPAEHGGLGDRAAGRHQHDVRRHRR